MPALDALLIEAGPNKSREIQAAINRLSQDGGGEVWFKRGIYGIDAPITLRDGVSLKGTNPKLKFTQNCPDLGFRLNGGTIFQGVTGRETCLIANKAPGINLPLANVHIEGIGFRRFEKAISVGSTRSNGFGFGGISRCVFEDIESWAVESINPQHWDIEKLWMFNVKRGILIQADHDNCSPGVMAIYDVFMYLRPLTSGGDYPRRYGILLESVGASQLDAIRLYNCQVNSYGANPADTISYYLKGNRPGTVNTISAFGCASDGIVNHAFKLVETRMCRLDIQHLGASLGAVVDMQNGNKTYITSLSDKLTIFADAPSTPFWVNGMLSHYREGSRLGFGPQYFVRDAKTVIPADSNSFGLEFDVATRMIGSSRFAGRDNEGSLQPASEEWSPLRTLRRYQRDVTSNISLNSQRAGIYLFTNLVNVVARLPVITSTLEGTEFVLTKKNGSGSVTVLPARANTIAHGLDFVLASQGDSLHIVADGDSPGNWIVMGSHKA